MTVPMTTTTLPLETTIGTVCARIDHDTRTSGGSTVKLSDPAAIISTGYAVALPHAERIVPLDDFGPETIRQYIADHADQTSMPGVHIGSWLDNGMVYLDLSVVIADRLDAVIVGVQAGQLAIFDLATFETVRLS